MFGLKKHFYSTRDDPTTLIDHVIRNRDIKMDPQMSKWSTYKNLRKNAKDAFQKFSKVLRNRKKGETLLNFRVISFHLYGHRWRWVFRATEMCLDRRIVWIPWTEHKKNEEMLRKIETKRTLRIRNRQLKLLGHKMKKEGLEDLTLTGCT